MTNKINKRNKLLFGLGVNDADYITQIRRKVLDLGGNLKSKIIWNCPFYVRWSSMLKRCYCKSYTDLNVSYEKVYVCEEWLLFSNFKRWMEQQDWQGRHLDKDILSTPGKLVYSPETCAFVDQKINLAILGFRESPKKYDLPIGVAKSRTKKVGFVATIARKGKNKNLGVFDTPMMSHAVWQKEKVKMLYSLISPDNDPRINDKIKSIADKIQEDISMNKETKDFFSAQSDPQSASTEVVRLIDLAIAQDERS